ncbi:MAG: sodium:proton antiporter [Planctomycetes bacterium]|nr:sodium:proton antiporter [Planctomycetota bacterium]
MKKVLVFSVLLVAGLIGSQVIAGLEPERAATIGNVVRIATMTLLGFIMIHVGYEFEIEKSKLRSYAVDYGVAATAAAFPWLFCAAYFVWVLTPAGGETNWSDALLAGRFAAPTSAGILFAMLAAAGLSATWLFKKARVLAIFDDLDTVLLMIPLKMLIVGARWQLAVIVVVMAVLLWVAWRWLHAVRWPTSWPWVLGYAVVITAVSEALYSASKVIDDVVPIHIEVLLPAFVLGCILARPQGADPHSDDRREGHQEGPESPEEQRVATLISGAFMVLVGLSMPKIAVTSESGWGSLAFHVLVITLLANLGKMFPLFCYRGEATWRERLALCIGMWPRGEVGAGVLVVSLGYGIGGTMVTVATLSLALNLVLTGVFIVWVKRLIAVRAG